MDAAVTISSFQDLAAIGTVLALMLTGMLWIVNAQVGKVRREVSPNGGGSIKDKVNLTYDAIKALAEDQKEWREEQRAHNERLYEADRRVHARLDDHIHDHLNG